MNTLNWANLPDIIGEKIIMMAAEKEYLDLNGKSIYPRDNQRFYTPYNGMWMEILYKFCQVCPKWKSIIFGSKKLFEVDEDKKANLSSSLC